MQRCEVEYCIYNRDWNCILDDVGINAASMCEECIRVTVDRDILEAEKERQLQDLERRWAQDRNRA